MSQTQMIQAGIQIEAARELGKLVRPVIQKIVHKVHHLRPEATAPVATQPGVAAQRPQNSSFGVAHTPQES